ncbi:MAG: hypothetical protein ABT01_01185 [Clostridium sp. SCN 57-10]|nr:MAG: hypothetical protein ABT01_01185 [Clostridium sp. SCN 57-10]
MNRQDFLTRLAAALASLTDGEVHKILVYYDEIISDRMEDGMTEQEAVESFGSVSALAQRILAETPLAQRVAAKAQTKNKGVLILLLAVTSPVWLPLLLAVGGVLLGLLGALFGIAVSLVAVFVSFAVASVACFIAGMARFATLGVASGLFAMGAGLILAALTVFGWFLMVGGVRALRAAARALYRRAALLFRRKEAVL